MEKLCLGKNWGRDGSETGMDRVGRGWPIKQLLLVKGEKSQKREKKIQHFEGIGERKKYDKKKMWTGFLTEEKSK